MDKIDGQKIISFLKQNVRLLITIGASLLALLGILLFYWLSEPNFNWQTKVYNQGLRNERLLDGKIVHTAKINLRPIAVIIENHVDSRPVAGLDQASVVYELIVEGDITRFLAIFDGSIEAKKIGPVRSVRPFFVDMAEEWSPVLFHAGGSTDGLQQVRLSSVYNINEISSDGIYFWRDPARQPPHNLYTSSNLVQRAIATKGVELEGDFSAWPFKEDNPIQSSDSLSDFEVNFSSNPFYNVFYQYNSAGNDYTRLANGKVHKTDQGIILKARNIIVQQVEAEIVDSYGRLEINLDGSGDAEVYQDGKKISGTWEKVNKRTRFYDLEHHEIRLNRGTIWVEIVFN